MTVKNKTTIALYFAVFSCFHTGFVKSIRMEVTEEVPTGTKQPPPMNITCWVTSSEKSTIEGIDTLKIWEDNTPMAHIIFMGNASSLVPNANLRVEGYLHPEMVGSFLRVFKTIRIKHTYKCTMLYVDWPYIMDVSTDTTVTHAPKMYDWEVRVFLSNDNSAGTVSEGKVQLKGSDYDSQEIDMPNNKQMNKFCRGCTYTIRFETPFIGNLRSIVFWGGHGDGMQVDKVEVQSMDFHKTYVFECNCWVKTNNEGLYRKDLQMTSSYNS